MKQMLFRFLSLILAGLLLAGCAVKPTEKETEKTVADGASARETASDESVRAADPVSHEADHDGGVIRELTETQVRSAQAFYTETKVIPYTEAYWFGENLIWYTPNHAWGDSREIYLFGEAGGYTVVYRWDTIAGEGGPTDLEKGIQVIHDLVFVIPLRGCLELYKDGEVVSLKEGFEKGLVSAEELDAIHRVYKTFSTIGLEDHALEKTYDFSDHELLICLKPGYNDASYTPQEFPEISCASVEDVSKAVREGEASRILKLALEEQGYQAVLTAVKKLEEREDVSYATPYYDNIKYIQANAGNAGLDANDLRFEKAGMDEGTVPTVQEVILAKIREKDPGTTRTVSSIHVDGYGSFGDAVVFAEAAYVAGLSTQVIEVNGIRFAFGSQEAVIRVLHQGEIYELREAYHAGILDEADIRKIYAMMKSREQVN